MISQEITRIQTARDTIRTKLISLGLATATSKLDDCASAIETIENKGAISANVQEGETFTIPKGYHNGSGTVSGVAGGGNYSLQSKTATPTKKQQAITADSGYYGLSDVVVDPIPDAFQNVSSVTAGATDVLSGKIIVTKEGTVTTGTMPNIGTVNKTLDVSTKSYTIAEGYHTGDGTVSISVETKTATPTKSVQTISPSTGKVLSSVTVNPIPAEYIVTNESTDVAASSEHILEDRIAYVNGERVEGSMPKIPASSVSLNTTTTSHTIPAGYHNGAGKVSITLEQKAVSPIKSVQNIIPTEGKVLSKVIVNAIPAEYITTTDADAQDIHILTGKTAYVKGEKLTGAMADNGDVSDSIDGLTIMSVSIPEGYTKGGTISLTNDIESALSAI
ncbi:MAG: hypothetical protein IJ981_03125 [Clostridia bacterium]|nr:hypothetical protein [Clostridia bacterium]